MQQSLQFSTGIETTDRGKPLAVNRRSELASLQLVPFVCCDGRLASQHAQPVLCPFLSLWLPQIPKHREVCRLRVKAGIPDPAHCPGRRHRAAVLLLAAMYLSPYDSQEGEAGLEPLGLLRVVRDNARKTSSCSS